MPGPSLLFHLLEPQSNAAYYYTKERRSASAGERRARYWAARPGEDLPIERVGWLDRVRALMPERIKRLIRAARYKSK